MVRGFFQSSIKYVIFVVALMLTQLSLMTGKFPPPVSESLTAIKGMQDTVNPENISQMKAQVKERNELIHALGSDAEMKAPDAEVKPQISVEDMAKELQALKYENMQLKSRLDNCSPAQAKK